MGTRATTLASALIVLLSVWPNFRTARAGPAPPVTHGSQISAAGVGPVAAGYARPAVFQGGEVKAKDYAFSRWIDVARSYDGFTVPAGHLLIENVTFTSPLDIAAPFPVVLRGVTVRLQHKGHWGLLSRQQAGAIFVLWSSVESAGDAIPDAALDIRSNAATVFRSLFTHAADGIHISGSDVLVQETVIDDLAAFQGSHNDGIQLMASAQRVQILANRIVNPNRQTSCLYLLGSDIHIANNYLAGGGWTLYGGHNNNGHGGQGGTVVATGNIFGHDYFPKSGSFGAVAYWDKNNRWDANTWSDGSSLRP